MYRSEVLSYAVSTFDLCTRTDLTLSFMPSSFKFASRFGVIHSLYQLSTLLVLPRSFLPFWLL